MTMVKMVLMEVRVTIERARYLNENNNSDSALSQ